MKIFYYTTTGNSLSVAKSFNGEVISMVQMLKEPEQVFESESIGFVFPVYRSSVPTIVEEFVRKHQFKGNYTFAIATYGNIVIGVENQFQNMLGFQLDYANKIKMVDNSLNFYDMTEELKILPSKHEKNN